MVRQIADLKLLTQAQYEREQQAFRSIVARETAVRDELARLSQQEHAARQNTDQTASMRRIGADVLWLGWVGRTKGHLNMALAQILAQKEHHLARVRKAYGKVLVTDELSKRQHTARRKSIQEAQLATVQDIAVWSTPRS